MKQIVIQPGFVEPTTITLVELDGIRTSFKVLVHFTDMTVDRVAEFLRGTDPGIPIIVEPGFPDLEESLKLRGFWVLK